MRESYDLFISHASVDKESIVEPLVKAFRDAGISCWYDTDNIEYGEFVTLKIQEGLATSRYVIVVLTVNFLKARFANFEFLSMLARKGRTGENRLIPLIVGSKSEKEEILDNCPLIEAIKYLSWDKGLDAIVDSIAKRLVEKKYVVSPRIRKAVLRLEGVFEINVARDYIEIYLKLKVIFSFDFKMRIYRGSVIYELELSEEDAKILQHLFDTGKLERILAVKPEVLVGLVLPEKKETKKYSWLKEGVQKKGVVCLESEIKKLEKEGKEATRLLTTEYVNRISDCVVYLTVDNGYLYAHSNFMQEYSKHTTKLSANWSISLGEIIVNLRYQMPEPYNSVPPTPAQRDALMEVHKNDVFYIFNKRLTDVNGDPDISLDGAKNYFVITLD